MSADGLRDEVAAALYDWLPGKANRRRAADAVLLVVQRHIDAAREQVAETERLLAEKSDEVDDKSRIGHAVADAWMAKAYEAEADRDAAVARAEAAEAAIERVRALHRRDFFVPVECDDCHVGYPCATIRALDGTP